LNRKEASAAEPQPKKTLFFFRLGREELFGPIPV
jgi:hypothetical protein